MSTSYTSNQAFLATCTMNGIVLVGALLLAICCTGNNSVFLEQPNSGQLFSPIGKLLVLNCTVSEGFVQTWFVTLPNISTPATSDSRRGVILLNDHGIYVQENSQMMSQLIFNRTSPIEVMMRCIATPTGSSDETPGNQVSIIIYGPPPTPTNLTSIENGPGSLNITWALEFFEEVAINFMLTVNNLNMSTQQLMFTTQELHYSLRVQSLTSCDAYSFTVRAMADSGSSPPSEVITRSIPSLPDITLVAHSVTHSLVKTENSRFTLNIRIQDMSTCLDYPVARYIVTLEDGGGNLRRVVVTNTTSITITDLAEDTHYVYYINAENQLGNSSNSSSAELLTTDVQNVSICQMEDFGYLIQCNYVEGSDACGCAYTISADGVESVTGTIARGNTEGVTVELADIIDVLVYDWECDNRTQSVPAPVDNTTTICPISTATTSTSDAAPINVAVSVVVASVLSATIVVVGFFILVLCVIKKPCRSKTQCTIKSVVCEVFQTILTSKAVDESLDTKCEQDFLRDVKSAAVVSTSADPLHSMITPEEPAPQLNAEPVCEPIAVDEGPVYSTPGQATPNGNEGVALKLEEYSDVAVAAPLRKKKGKNKSKENKPPPFSPPFKTTSNVEPESEATDGPLYSTLGEATTDAKGDAALKVEEYSDVVVSAPSRKKKPKDKSKSNKPPQFLVKAPPYKASPSHQTEGTRRVVENDNSTYSEISSQPKRSRGKNSMKAVGVVKTSQFKCKHCPKGLFGVLVTHLMTPEAGEREGSAIAFALRDDKIFKDQVFFAVQCSGDFDTISLKAYSTHLEIKFFPGSLEDRDEPVSFACEEVRKAIAESINKSLVDLHYSKERLKPSVCLRCTQKSCSDLHPVFKGKHFHKIHCDKTGQTGRLPAQGRCWYNEDAGETSTSLGSRGSVAESSRETIAGHSCASADSGPPAKLPRYSYELEHRNICSSGPTASVTPTLCCEDHVKVVKYLKELSNQEITNIGVRLGLHYARLKRMSCESLMDDMVLAWLRKDDDVGEISGDPSWQTLCTALKECGHTGIVSSIQKRH